LAAGKPETGLLHLKAYHQGSNIVVELQDDDRRRGGVQGLAPHIRPRGTPNHGYSNEDDRDSDYGLRHVESPP
jgi:hypothetical protein